MVTGSIAASDYGLAERPTILTLFIATPEKLKDLICYSREIYAMTGCPDAWRHQSMFNIIDTTRGWKIDFILQKSMRFHREAFRRRTTVTYEGVRHCIISGEDLVISKLEWSKWVNLCAKFKTSR